DVASSQHGLEIDTTGISNGRVHRWIILLLGAAFMQNTATRSVTDPIREFPSGGTRPGESAFESISIICFPTVPSPLSAPRNPKARCREALLRVPWEPFVRHGYYSGTASTRSAAHHESHRHQIGRASCRERVYVSGLSASFRDS